MSSEQKAAGLRHGSLAGQPEWNGSPVPWAPRWIATRCGKIIGPKGSPLAATPNARGGYPSVRIGNPKRTRQVHTIIAETYLGPRPDGKDVAHLNGDPSDNRVENLAYVSRRENHHHKYAHGTMRMGASVPTAVLTETDVRQIRSRHAAGEGYKNLGRAFGVEWSTIRAIIKGRNWSHVI